jgi:hypothetical protein
MAVGMHDTALSTRPANGIGNQRGLPSSIPLGRRTLSLLDGDINSAVTIQASDADVVLGCPSRSVPAVLTGPKPPWPMPSRTLTEHRHG